MTVYPAINVAEGDEAGLSAKLDAIRGLTDRIHVDVADGTFTSNRSWQDPVRLRELSGGMKMQAHLMVDNPEEILESWLAAGADEIVVHLEPLLLDDAGEPAVIRLGRMRDTCLRYDAKLLIGGGPHLESRALLTHRAYADGFLVLAVDPGASGQALQPASLDVVRVIRDTFPDDVIWVDGGVNRDTRFEVSEAGATYAVAASAIFDAEDPTTAFAALQ